LSAAKGHFRYPEVIQKRASQSFRPCFCDGTRIRNECPRSGLLALFRRVLPGCGLLAGDEKAQSRAPALGKNLQHRSSSSGAGLLNSTTVPAAEPTSTKGMKVSPIDWTSTKVWQERPVRSKVPWSSFCREVASFKRACGRSRDHSLEADFWTMPPRKIVHVSLYEAVFSGATQRWDTRDHQSSRNTRI
jgi:hypothetical protein